MKHVKFLSLALILIYTLIGCENVTEPEKPTQSNTNSSGQPMPKFANAENLAGIMATIYYEVSSLPNVPAVGLAMGYSQFGSMVNAGTVMVNDNSLGKSTAGGKVFYMTPGAGSFTGLNGVSFNGSYHNWSVSGAGSVPEMSGKVQSPKAFNVTSPANNSTISKAKDLKITWTGGYSSSTEKVLIVLINNSTAFTAEELDNNGTYTIPSSKIKSGNAMLQVVKYRYATISKDSKDYYMVSEIVKTIKLTIN